MASVKKLLVDSLKELVEADLKDFQWHLVNLYLEHLSRSELEKADRLDTVDMMVKCFGPEEAVKVMVDILRKMNQNDLAEQLENGHKQAQTEGNMKTSVPVGDKVRAPDLRKECLDKFCTELGYRNLSYLKDLCTTSTHTEFDTTDGCFNGKGFRIIKATIVLLLQHIIDNKLRDECEGCATDHPSQLQHSCLFEPDAYYFDSRFDELCRKLFKPDLQTIIDFTLRRYGLMTNNILMIQGTTGAILHELRDEPFIVAKLQEIREKLLDESNKKVVYDAVDLWQSSVTAPGV